MAYPIALGDCRPVLYRTESLVRGHVCDTGSQLQSVRMLSIQRLIINRYDGQIHCTYPSIYKF